MKNARTVHDVCLLSPLGRRLLTLVDLAQQRNWRIGEPHRIKGMYPLVQHYSNSHTCLRQIYHEVSSAIINKLFRTLTNYYQDELEREVERLKERLARSQKKSSKTGLPEDSRSSVSSSMSSASILSSTSRSAKFSDATISDSTSRGEEVCEICERPGHDIFTCDLLKDDRPLSSASMGSKRANEDIFCEDCEEHGHTAANCPHALDVF